MEENKRINEKDFLESGSRTQVGEKINGLIKDIAAHMEGKSTEEVIAEIMEAMQNVPMERDGRANTKFKRSAEEIATDGFRNGCCDSSTLFVTMCRALAIPAMQIITAKIPALKRGDFSRGHFFSACYIKESNSWKWLDSDKQIKNKRKVHLHDLDESSSVIDNDYYIFALAKDYADLDFDGLKIDSIESMNKVHRKVYEQLSENDEKKPFARRTLRTIAPSKVFRNAVSKTTRSEVESSREENDIIQPDIDNEIS